MAVIQTVAFCLAMLSFVGIMFCVISHEWKVSSQIASQNSLNNLELSEGLWLRCTKPQAGLIQCDNYDTTLFNVAVYLQALRAMMILSTLFASSGIIMNIMCLDCVKVMDGKKNIWAARGAGVLLILAALLCLASVSWYAKEVIDEFRNQYKQQVGLKYTFGAALYVGWTASGLALLAGSLLVCCSCVNRDDENTADYGYRYNPSKPVEKNSEEYV